VRNPSQSNTSPENWHAWHLRFSNPDHYCYKMAPNMKEGQLDKRGYELVRPIQTFEEPAWSSPSDPIKECWPNQVAQPVVDLRSNLKEKVASRNTNRIRSYWNNVKTISTIRFKNKEERYSRVPRLTDTRYSAKGTKGK